MTGNKRGRPAVGLQTCMCGYESDNTSHFKRHKTTCPMVKEDSMLAAKDEIIANLKEQLAGLQKQMFELAKAPRTVNNIKVDSNVNVFGKESIEHISDEQIQKLLADPPNAVPQFIKLRLNAPGDVNKNIRVPNKKRPIYQAVVDREDGEKEWENKAKGEVLEHLYDDVSGELDAEADEDTLVGSQFLNHQEKVKASMNGEDGGKRYKEQLDKIHCVVLT